MSSSAAGGRRSRGGAPAASASRQASSTAGATAGFVDWLGWLALGGVGLVLLAELPWWRLQPQGPVWAAVLLGAGAVATECVNWARHGRRQPQPLAWWLLTGFVALTLISAFWAYVPGPAFASLVVVGAAYSAGVIVFRLCQARAGRVRIALAVVLVYLVISALLSLETASSRLLLRPTIDAIAASSPETAAVYGAWTGQRLMTLTTSNAAAAGAIAGLVLAGYFFATATRRRARLLNVAAAVVLALEAVLCGSLGAGLVGVAALVAAVWLTPRPERLRVAGFLGGAATAGVLLALPVFWLAPATAGAGSSPALPGVDKTATATERIAFWGDALRIAADAPLLGQGPGVFEVRALQVQDVFRESKYVHNHYLQVLTETGAVGLALWVVFLAVVAVALWRGSREVDRLARAEASLKRPSSGSAASGKQAAACRAILVAGGLLAVHGAIDLTLSLLPGIAVLLILAGAGCAIAPEVGPARLRALLDAHWRWLRTLIVAGSLAPALLVAGWWAAPDPAASDDAAQAALTLDPLHRADHWAAALVARLDGPRAAGFAAKLDDFGDRSVTANQVLVYYHLSQGDLDLALHHIEAIPAVRPLDPASRLLALDLAHQVRAELSDDTEAVAAIDQTIARIG